MSGKKERDDYRKFSKKRLLNNLTKKFNTTTIGSLAIFEEDFGFLWGHGLPHSDLSDEQKEYRKLWKKTRISPLDAGHSNLRACQSEISQYSVRWNRYVTNFSINQDNQGE